MQQKSDKYKMKKANEQGYYIKFDSPQNGLNALAFFMNRKNKALQELDIVEQDGGPFTEEQTIELEVYREKLNTILDNVTVPPEIWPISATVLISMSNKENT